MTHLSQTLPLAQTFGSGLELQYTERESANTETLPTRTAHFHRVNPEQTLFAPSEFSLQSDTTDSILHPHDTSTINLHPSRTAREDPLTLTSPSFSRFPVEQHMQVQQRESSLPHMDLAPSTYSGTRHSPEYTQENLNKIQYLHWGKEVFARLPPEEKFAVLEVDRHLPEFFNQNFQRRELVENLCTGTNPQGPQSVEQVRGRTAHSEDTHAYFRTVGESSLTSTENREKNTQREKSHHLNFQVPSQPKQINREQVRNLDLQEKLPPRTSDSTYPISHYFSRNTCPIPQLTIHAHMNFILTIQMLLNL